MKYTRKGIFALLDRDCVNPTSQQIIKDYINRLVTNIESNQTKKKRSK